MKINPEIKKMLAVIAAASVRYHNEPSRHVRYIRRILKVYDNHLSEEERVYILYSLIELIHYRNLAVDPDNMITISNIKLRSMFFIFMATIVLMVVAAVLFTSDSGVGGVIPMMLHFLKIFTI